MTQILIASGFIILCLCVSKYRPKAAVYLLAAYLLALAWLALLARTPSSQARYNLEIYGALRRGIASGTLTGTGLGSLYEVIQNVLVFVPVGLLTPCISRRTDRWWKAALWGLALSLTVEIIQLLTHRGFFDVDDLIDNTLGAGLGWLLYRASMRRGREGG